VKKIFVLESQVIRAAMVALASLIGLILSYFGVDEAVVNEQAGRIIDAILLLIASGSTLWAAWARAYLPTPPITDSAAYKMEARMQIEEREEGGYAHPLFLGVLAIVATSLVLAGCVGTRQAYRGASTPDEYAYVLAEHYAALVKEAANLKERPSTPRPAVEAMQKAELAARPVVLQLKPLRDAYLEARSAETEAELQVAIDRAVLAIADLVRALRAARGETASSTESVPMTLTWRPA